MTASSMAPYTKRETHLVRGRLRVRVRVRLRLRVRIRLRVRHEEGDPPRVARTHALGEVPTRDEAQPRAALLQHDRGRGRG